MRLIDADRVLLNKDERMLGYADINAALKLQMLKIVNAPTVEAIPIEWLRMWFTKKASLIGITLMGEIESDWEKENENR